MDDIHIRLRSVREEHGLSLRQMAARLASSTGQRVSHDSVRHYEEGRDAPSRFLIAVCSAFNVSCEWLLFGRGSIRVRGDSDALAALEAVGDIVRAFRSEKDAWESDGWTGVATRRWRQFLAGLTPADPIGPFPLDSWRPAVGGEVRKRDDSDLAERVAAMAEVTDIAAPHVRLIHLVLGDLDHVMVMTDGDGIIVDVGAAPASLATDWRMEPGADWSRPSMGETAVARALESGGMAAVLGTEAESFHQFACLAVPIRDGAGTIMAVLSLANRLPDAYPQRLAIVAYGARMIERDLELRAPSPSS